MTEIVRFVSFRGPARTFHFADGSPLTKAAFVNHVRTTLSTVGVTASAYADHSFCIGTATATAEAGLEDSVIRLLGRWNSDAFLRYVRTPRDVGGLHGPPRTNKSYPLSATKKSMMLVSAPFLPPTPLLICIL